MFWADRIAENIEKRFGRETPVLVRDEKTISGRVHVGSMRGVAIHGCIADALTRRGIQTTFRYELNDFDVFDSVPHYLDVNIFEAHLGKLLLEVPSPVPGYPHFAAYYGAEFRKTIEESGFHPEFYWGSEPYLSGAMDGVIKEALEHHDAIRRIYKEVSGGERNDTWLPINVICPTCHKVATTVATDFDGQTVRVVCHERASSYTKGCGFEGRLSPFGGTAKLPWKPEWAAKWKVHSVMVEGGGKDHSTKGGSRDVANHISHDVFHYESPFDIPYEFFLVGGQKMSSSKGRGSSAHEVAELLPPKIFRLALLSKDIMQAFNFDPEGDTIPVLFDLYDKLAEGYWGGATDDYARLFENLHPDLVPAQTFLPRFSQIAFIAQMPHLDLFQEVEKLKEDLLTDADRAEAKERALYALKWLNLYAPEKFVFKVDYIDVPEAARALSDLQKQALQALSQFIDSHADMPSGEELHQRLHALKDDISITPSELFSAVYLTFLGKSYGPKAGWFLSVLPRDFVLKRLAEVNA